MPYRDFGYTQAPLLPYLQAIPLRLTGFSMLGQRVANALWSGLTLVVLWGLARPAHRARAVWGLLALAALPTWVYFGVLGKTYALAGLLVVLAVAAGRLAPGHRQALAFGLAGSLAVGCRLLVAPAVCVLWISLLWKAQSRRARLWLALAPPLLGVGLAAPFFAADPQAFLFWNLGLHAAVHRDFRLDAARDLLSHLPTLAGLLAVSLAAAGSAWRESVTAEGALLLAGGVGVAAQLLPHGAFAEYATPLLPLLALGVLRVGQRSLRPGWPRAAAAGIVILGLWVRPAHVVADRGRVLAVRACEAYLRAYPPETTVVTAYPILTTGAGLRVLPDLELGYFGVSDELPPAQAARLHLSTPDTLAAAVRDGTVDVVVLSLSWPNFLISLPSCEPIPEARWDPLYAALAQDFRQAHRDHHFVILARASR